VVYNLAIVEIYQTINMPFDKTYFSSGKYSTYESLARAEGEIVFQQIDSSISLDKKWKYLDIGCGLGFTVSTFRQKGYRAFGIEISEYCCDNSPVKEWITAASTTNIPFPQNLFDISWSKDVLYYLDLPQIVQALHEIHRVTRIGFFLECIVKGSPTSDQQRNPDNMRQQDRLLTHEQWENLLLDAGFVRSSLFVPPKEEPDILGFFLKQ
jgi:SAM-dependent methyltransferase